MTWNPHQNPKRRQFQAARIDKNQPEIVRTFRQLGCNVAHTHAVGKGFTDLVVDISGLNVLVEIKNGKKPPSARKYTPQQELFNLGWSGLRAKVESPDDVVALVKHLRDWLARLAGAGMRLPELSN